MPNRHNSFDDQLAKKFESPKFAQQYLINISKSSEKPLDEVLKETIKAMGLLEFSERSGLSIQAVVCLLNIWDKIG